MKIYPLKSKRIDPNTSLFKSLSTTLQVLRLGLQDGDIIAVSSKVVSISEGRLRNLTNIVPTSKAVALSKKYGMEPKFVQVILDEADRIIGGVKGTLLTVVDGNATANAGVDRKNAPDRNVVLWPQDADRSARTIRRQLSKMYKKKIGIIIVDSRVTPLRLGTIGFAIGSAGINPLHDFRGQYDIYDRKIQITLHAVADSLAAIAQFVMGEGDEKIPFVLIRDANIDVNSQDTVGVEMTKLSVDDCLYMSKLRK